MLQCARCARCAFVSFSKHFGDCSWYAVCDQTLTEVPQQPPGAGRRFVTVHVKDLQRDREDCLRVLEPPHLSLPTDDETTPPPPAQRLRFGIATLFYRNHGGGGGGCTYECGLLGWCAAARRLQATLPATWHSALLLLLPAPPDEGAKYTTSW